MTSRSRPVTRAPAQRALAALVSALVPTCVAVLLTPGRAAAQRPAADTLETVQVTVLRTPFDLSSAPASVATVGSHEAAAARPGFALDEVLGGVAGVQVDNRLNFALGERIAIRGVGARAQFGVRGIRVLVDDIPATLADGQSALNNVDLGSIGGAEILRGAASALYGNASGGVVALTTAAPPAVALAPSSRVVYGSHGLLRAQAGAGGTRGRAAYVLNAGRFDYRGFRAHGDARNAHGNALLTYDAGRTDVRLVANAVRYDARNPGSLSDSLLRDDRTQAFANNVLQRTGERGRQLQLGVSSRTTLARGELRLSGYALHRSLDNPIPPRVIELARAAGGVRAAYAVTMGNPGRMVTALAGAESDLQRDDRQNYVNVRGARGDLVLDQRERVTSASPFVQLGATAGAFSALGALRYDHFRFAAADHLVTADDPDDSGTRHLSAVSPTVGLSWRAAPGVSVYANAAGAFQTPTTTELANRPDGAGGLNPALRPEHTRSGEVGANIAARRGVTAHAAGYLMRTRGALVPFELESFPGRQFYRNAGVTMHRGLEAELVAPVTPSVSVRVAYTLTNARFTTYAVNGTSHAGRRVPGVVPQLATAAVDVHPGGSPVTFASLTLRAQSATQVDDANRAHSPGYVTADVRGQYGLTRTLAAFGGIGNVAGARYNTSVVVNAAGGRYFEPASGRTVFAGLQFGFD